MMMSQILRRKYQARDISFCKVNNKEETLTLFFQFFMKRVRNLTDKLS